MTENEPTDYSRRDALKRGGLVAGVAGAVWAAPSITTLGGAAFAQGSDPDLDGPFSLGAFFNGSNNPAGPFELRQAAGLLSEQALLFGAIPSLQGGNSRNNDASFPVVGKNGATPVVRGTILVPAGAVFIHPDNSESNPLIIRFTAPRAGTYAVSGAISDADSGGGSIAFAFSVPGGNAGTVTPNGSTPLAGSFTIAAGGAVDLLITPNGAFDNDSHTLELTYTRTP